MQPARRATRDARALVGAGYVAERLAVFDHFPYTKHPVRHAPAPRLPLPPPPPPFRQPPRRAKRPVGERRRAADDALDAGADADEAGAFGGLFSPASEQ